MLVVREGTRCRVQRCWEGFRVVCIAGGPSLTEAAIERIERQRAADRVRVIVVNDSYLLAPWADAAYFADASWWHRQGQGFERRWPWKAVSAAQMREARASFAGAWLSIQHHDAVRDARVFLLENAGSNGLSPTPYGVCTGCNSGYQALNVAAWTGAASVLLLGYDMRHQGKRTHAHDGHPRMIGDGTWAGFAKHFHSLERPLAERGVRVLNCSPDSRITAFPGATLEEALA